MRKLFVTTTAALTVILAGTLAMAGTGPVTRLGIDYSGVANVSWPLANDQGSEGACVVGPDDVHPTELRVDCSARTGATHGARIRYRFLADVGGVRAPATVSADIHNIRGKDCNVTWRGPIRTLRVSVPLGSYCHIRTATWQQP